MKEYKEFVNRLIGSMRMKGQIKTHIDHMNNEKKKILKMIKEEGLGFDFNGEWIPLQYYAH